MLKYDCLFYIYMSEDLLKRVALTGITLASLFISGCAGGKFSFVGSDGLREAVKYDMEQEKERKERVHSCYKDVCYPLKLVVYEF